MSFAQPRPNRSPRKGHISPQKTDPASSELTLRRIRSIHNESAFVDLSTEASSALKALFDGLTASCRRSDFDIDALKTQIMNEAKYTRDTLAEQRREIAALRSRLDKQAEVIARLESAAGTSGISARSTPEMTMDDIQRSTVPHESKVYNSSLPCRPARSPTCSGATKSPMRRPARNPEPVPETEQPPLQIAEEAKQEPVAPSSDNPFCGKNEVSDEDEHSQTEINKERTLLRLSDEEEPPCVSNAEVEELLDSAQLREKMEALKQRRQAHEEELRLADLRIQKIISPERRPTPPKSPRNGPLGLRSVNAPTKSPRSMSPQQLAKMAEQKRAQVLDEVRRVQETLAREKLMDEVLGATERTSDENMTPAQNNSFATGYGADETGAENGTLGDSQRRGLDDSGANSSVKSVNLNDTTNSLAAGPHSHTFNLKGKTWTPRRLHHLSQQIASINYQNGNATSIAISTDAEVDLSGKNINDGDVQALCKIVKYFRGATNINLKCNYVGNAGAAAIASSWQEWPESIAFLNVRHNRISEKGAQAFSAGLSQCRLRELWLGFKEHGSKYTYGTMEYPPNPLAKSAFMELWNKGMSNGITVRY